MARPPGPVRRRVPTAWVGILLLASALLAAWSSPARALDGQAPTAPPVLELFWAEGCPFCETEREWLPHLEAEYPELVVRTYEITSSPANRALMDERAAEHGIRIEGVPATFVGDQHWIGFNERIAAQIAAAVEASVARAPAPEPDHAAVIDVPLVGEVDLGATSLVTATLLIGALDGVNPCSLWALSVLLALVLHTRSRRRVFVVGAVFLTITAGMYALYVGGLYSVLTYVTYTAWIRVALALVAATFGAIAIKDFFWFRRGITMSIPEGRKPGIYRRMRRITATDRPLLPVLGGTALLAVGVSLVETPCTAGFPIVWTNLLSSQGVGGTGAAGLFLLYMLVFLLDEVVVFSAAVITLRAARLQEHHGRLLKLVSGVVMLTLAGVMLVAPELLESVTGTLVVFGAAAAATTTIALLHRAAHPAGQA